MAFFLESLLGGLMAGMLYSLVALGFVLIYKASGVFNFAQGAMVLFAALAMARFAEWIPLWTGMTNPIAANLAAFVIAGIIMFTVAWLIERLALRHLVNQEGTTLLMATLGISYFLDGLGQTIFGSDIYKIDVGMPKEPIMAFETLFDGGILINKEDLYAALIAAVLVTLLSVFFQKTATGRARRAVADDHHAAQSIGGRPGRRHDLGQQAGSAVFTHDGGAARAAGGDSGWPDFGAGRHHWRPHHRRRRKVVRSIFGTLCGRRY
jgi:branched-chain amino acid transport system permease protein